METHAIVGDLQFPYHDPEAVEVALQILEDAKVTSFTINGDLGDWRVLSMRYPVQVRAELVASAHEELERQRTFLDQLDKRVKAKRKNFNAGNHEWRVDRALSVSPQMLQLLGIKEIREATATENLLQLKKRGYRYSGGYPSGFWLTDGPTEQNVWVEHGYLLSKNAGYTAHRLMGERWSNVVTGHCERLALVWSKRVGDRRFFGIEGGNLSRINQPKKSKLGGLPIYTGIPHAEAEYLNAQQGIVLLYTDGKEWWPYPVPIHHGRAFFAGRSYRA